MLASPARAKPHPVKQNTDSTGGSAGVAGKREPGRDSTCGEAGKGVVSSDGSWRPKIKPWQLGCTEVLAGRAAAVKTMAVQAEPYHLQGVPRPRDILSVLRVTRLRLRGWNDLCRFPALLQNQLSESRTHQIPTGHLSFPQSSAGHAEV